MGLFGVAEVLENAERPLAEWSSAKMSSLVPTRQDMRDSVWPIVRGDVLGFLGLIPGMTAIRSFYRSGGKEGSKNPEKFGTGVIEGVAGPETANNAHANAALIPLFTLGIPGSPTWR